MTLHYSLGTENPYRINSLISLKSEEYLTCIVSSTIRIFGEMKMVDAPHKKPHRS